MAKDGYHPLHDELRKAGSAKNIPRLLEEHADECNQADSGNNYPLHIACKHLDSDSVQYVLGKYKGACKKKNEQGDYPLHLACSSGASPKLSPAPSTAVRSFFPLFP